MTYMKVACKGCVPSYFAIANNGTAFCYNKALGASRHPYTIMEIKDYLRKDGECKVTIGPRAAREAASVFAERNAWFNEAEFMAFARAMADEYSALA